MSAEWIQTAFGVAGIIFLAGQVYRSVGQLRRDLNGLGAKANSDRITAERRYHNLCLALLVIEQTRDGREKMAELLRDQP